MTKRLYSGKRGFTLLEVLLCSVIILVIWLGPIDILFKSTRNVSYAKHMAQAIYLAKLKMEEWHKCPFSPTLQNLASAIPSAPVITSEDMDGITGFARCTVTITNLNPIDANRVRAQIDITWPEGTLNGKETLTSDIANEAQLY